MGYTTGFAGRVEIVPPLNAEEVAYLNKFSETRRMARSKGPYFVDGTGEFGQGRDSDIEDHNHPPQGQPGLWCKWVPTDDGMYIKWSGAEKFYDSAEWMKYLIEHFIKPGALAIGKVPAIKGGHIVNGTIDAQGEDSSDVWKLIVKDNAVFVKRGCVVFEEDERAM